MQARSAVTLDKILAAAEAVVARTGVGSLTMDAVAAEAGISKGGVLHHFRSKDALVTALVLSRLRRMEEELAADVHGLRAQPNKTLRGMIAHGSRSFGHDAGFPRALLVAAVENSQSLEAFRAMMAGTLDAVRRESRAPEEGTALLFAVIGLLVSQTLGFAAIEPAQASRIFQALDGMVTGWEDGITPGD